MRKSKKNLTSLFLSTIRNNFIFFKRMIKNFELVEMQFLANQKFFKILILTYDTYYS